MTARCWFTIALAILGSTLLPGSALAQKAASDVFGLDKVHEFHLELTAREWERLQMVRGGMPFGMGGFGGPKKQPESPKVPPGEESLEFHKSAGFGTEFPWAHATLSAAGKTYKNVGIRYKGNGSYMTSGNVLKRNFRIDLDHYDKDLRFQGLKTITLNAGAMDPGRLREALAYAVYREAGVPAPRTAFAQVTLTVPGKLDKEFVGLYTFVEHVDKTFLKDRFTSNKGVLLKPERMRGLEYLGEDWGPYKARYQPKHEPSKKESKRVIEFVRLVNRADDAKFQNEIVSYLDVEKFLRFLAVTALIANQDSFFTIGHNYYIYLDPGSNKFVFMPWDLDLAFGGFPMGGSAAQQMDLSLTHPYGGDNKLTDRLLANKEVRARYDQIVKELTTSCFTKEKLLSRIEQLEKATKPLLAQERQASTARKEKVNIFGFGPFGAAPDLRAFVDKRHASALAQLDGKSKGYVPTMGFPFGGPMGKGGPPMGGPGKGGFGPGIFFAKPLLANLDTDKDGKLSKDELLAGAKRLFADCDKDKKGKLDEAALVEGLSRLFPPPPDFGPGGGKAPKGFGPAMPLAGAIMTRADKDKDGRVTVEELVAAAEALFKECDNDGKGKLDETAVAAGINLLFPPPPGIGPGPPGAGPPSPAIPPKKAP